MKTKSLTVHLFSITLCLLALMFMGIPVLAADTPPTVITKEASAITINSAILNGDLTSLGSANSLNVFFEYGTTTNYGNSTSAIVTADTGAFSAQLNGISPGVTYHYRTKADGGTAGVATGEDYTLTTLTIAPIVRTLLPLNIVGNGATFNGSLDSLGTAASVNIYFEYGKTTSYGSVTPNQSKKATCNYSATVTGLSPDTYYHFRARVNGGAQGSDEGEDAMFKTPATMPPQVSTMPAISVTDTTATLVGNIETPGSATSVKVSFEYGSTMEYGLTTSIITKTGAGYTGGFSIDITSKTPLTRGTTYHFRAKADGGANGVSYGQDLTFKTSGLAPLTPPTVDTAAVSDIATGTVTLNGNLILMGTAPTVSVYFEYGKTTTYGSGSTAQTMNDIGGFSSNVTGLAAGTSYHFRAKADGGASGVNIGPDMTFTTASISPSVNTAEATEISNNSAILNGSLASTGTAGSVKVFFEYGNSENYNVTTLTQTLTGTGVFTINLAGLKPATTYHFRAKADGGLSGTANGNDMTFTTLSPSINIVPGSTLKITPATVNIGDNITIAATVINSGDIEGTYPVTLKINGLIEKNQEVTVPAGASLEVNFVVTKNNAGTYQADINGLTGSFTISQVTSTPTNTSGPITTTTAPPKQTNNMQVLAIGGGAAVVVGILVYMLIRRRSS